MAQTPLPPNRYASGVHRVAAFLLLPLALAGILSCADGNGETAVGREPPPITTAFPAQGSAATLDFGAWNVEWFGDTANGPADEGAQQRNARDLILGTDCDIWSLEEVVDPTAFAQLVAGLPGYGGLLASDASVLEGASYYSPGEQKVALLYKRALASVQGARIILGSHSYDFAGRPPMEVQLSVTLNGRTSTLYVICLHAKAGSDSTSYGRRASASIALKDYLDTVRAGDSVLVLGDFNDELGASITSGQASPYQNFVADTARYFAPTQALSNSIDHHISVRGLAPNFLPGSAQAFPAAQYLPGFYTSTSDHLPVITRWSGL